MNKAQMLERLIELGAEYIRYTGNGTDFTVYRNLPLGIGYINITVCDGVYSFIDINWRITGRLPDAEILEELI